MRNRLHKAAWWAIGVFLGALVTDYFHGWIFGGWRPVVAAVLCFSAVLWVLTAEPVVLRLPSVHAGRRDGFWSVWLEPAAKPLRSAQKAETKRQVRLGRRAIKVGAEVLQAYGEARQATESLAVSPWDDPDGHARYLSTYAQELNKLKARIGGKWSELLADLDEEGVLPHPPNHYKPRTNFTGLDTSAIEVQALGRQLMRKHGKEPPS